MYDYTKLLKKVNTRKYKNVTKNYQKNLKEKNPLYFSWIAHNHRRKKHSLSKITFEEYLVYWDKAPKMSSGRISAATMKMLIMDKKLENIYPFWTEEEKEILIQNNIEVN
jgi:hypothetical protein